MHRSDSDYLKRLILHLPARQWEIIDATVKASHDFDLTVTMHVITNNF